MKYHHRLILILTLLSTLVSACGGNAPATPSGSDAADAATLELTGAVEQPQTWTRADLEAFGPGDVAYTNKDGETTVYQGVPLATLLDEAGVQADATTLIFAASDGYEAQAPLAELEPCTECSIAFQPQSGFRVVLPDFPSNVQVRDLIEVRVLTDAEAIPSAPETGEEAIPNDGPVTVIDAAGRTVDFERLPRRIVVIGRAPYMGLHLLYMFPEGRTRLVGAESKSATPSDFLPHVNPDFLDSIASMAANPNPEQIAALEPDLVLMKSVVMEQMGEALAQVDIPVVYLGLETPEQFFQDTENLGLLLGNPERATEIIGFYEGRLEHIAKTIAGVPEAEKPRVLLLQYSDRGGEVAVQVPARAWMQTIELETAGGIPVWLDEAQITDGWTVVNFEQIAAWNPDKIFVVIWYSLDPQDVIDGLKADPQWSKLAAVQNGELYAFPADIFGWDNPEPRWILGMTWLAKQMYPDRFADVDMEAEIDAFFGELYGMSPEAIDEVIMPRVHLNVR